MKLRRTQMQLCNCATAQLRDRIECLYRIDAQNPNTKRVLGKREVSLGESGSFVRGKSRFPLGKVQRAKMG